MQAGATSGLGLASGLAAGHGAGTLAGARSLDEARAAAASAEGGRLEEAAKAFEALFATVMVKELRRGLSDGFFGSEAGADVFEGWLDEHLGEALAATGTLDVAGFIRVNLENKQVALEGNGVLS